VDLGEIVNKGGTVFSAGSVDNGKVFRGDLELEISILSVVDLSKVRAFNDSTADGFVFLLKNAAFESDLFGFLLADTGGKDDLDSHILKFLHLSSQLAFIVLFVEDRDGLNTEIIKRGNFLNGIFVLNANIAFEHISSGVLQSAIPDGRDGQNVGVTVHNHHSSNAG